MRRLDIVIPAKDPRVEFVEVVELWLKQVLPDDWDSHFFIVDDGSRSFDFDVLVRRHARRLTLITHAHPRGRAAACNAGMRAGAGSYVAFFDADCFPAHTGVLSNFIDTLEAGADLVYGALTSQGNGFWGRYFRDVCAQRERRFTQGDAYALTTACCVVRRELLQRVGGFDECYRHYGFEDRDLIIRLMALAPVVAFSPRSVVVHGDDLHLEDICRKQQEAGRCTSGLFRGRHPAYYARMSFASVDSRQESLLNWVAWMLPLVLPGLLRVGQGVVESAYIPYALKALLVKLLSGLFYFKGTQQSGSEVEQ